MRSVFTILSFGFPYIRRYWFRFALGVLFGFLFGLSNGFTIGGVKLILNRLGASSAIVQGKVSTTAASSAPSVAQPAGSPPEATARPASLTDSPATRAEIDRADGQKEGNPISHRLHAALKAVGQAANVALDPWLPLAGRPFDWRQLAGGLLFFPILALFRGVMNYLSSYFMTWAGQRIVNDIKLDLFRKISSLSLDFYHRHNTSELLGWVNGDTGVLQGCLRLGFSDLIKEPTAIVTLLVTLLIFDWKLTLVALIFMPLCLIPTRLISRRIKKQTALDYTSTIAQQNITLESFQNVRVTKAFDLAAEHARLFVQANQRASRSALKVVQARAMLNPLLETLNAFGIGAVLLYAIWARVPADTVGVFLFALILFYAPFKKLSSIHVYFSQAGFAVERLMQVMKYEPSVGEPAVARPLPQFQRVLALRNVGFSYGDGLVLEGIDFEIRRGERIGLVGESGSGKSSLINLFLRFYDPTQGEISIDGVPLTEVRVADLRRQMALVSQDVLLFDATVSENISFGRLGASREEIVQAAHEAHAHRFIEALPLGYDQPLGERGVRLSGGQRQRVAIARAFVRNAPILILDEATASLDSQSEAEVQRAIDHLAENRTVICVAHRLSTLRTMDRIYVLREGRIVETGSFDALLERQGLFAAMAARQSIFSSAGETR